MPGIERMKDQLASWGLISQVWELVDAGFPLTTAIGVVYKAHVGGKAFLATQYNKAA